MGIESLQLKINRNELDPTTLTPEQAQAVDQAFKDGHLDGFRSLQDLQNYRDRGRQKLASEIETAEETVPGVDLPVVGRSFTERSGFETAGSAVGMFVPYVTDRPKLIQAFDPRVGQQFGPAYRQGFVKSTSNLANILEKVPVLKRFGLAGRVFGRTIAALKNAGSKVDDAARFGLTQATRTELKSIGGAALGAGAGSAVFDTINNFQDDVAAGIAYDLADISEKEASKLGGVQKTIFNSLDAMKSDLLYSGVGTALAPMVMGTAKYFAKGLTGTGTKEAKDVAELAQKYGVDLNLGQAARSDTLFGGLVKGFFTTLGIFPNVTNVAKRNRAVQEKKLQEKMFQFAEDLAPITTARIMGYQAMDVLNNNYRQFMHMIDNSFEALKNEAVAMGDPAIIPTTKIRQAASDYLNSIQIGNIKQLNLKDDKRFAKSFIENNPPVALFTKFAETGIFDDKFYITPNQLLELKKTLNQAVKDAPNNRQIISAATEMRLAMDKDLASVSDATIQKEVLEKSPDFKKKLDALPTKEAKENFIREQTEELATFGKNLRNTFHMFSAVTAPFNGITAKGLQKYGDYLFTAKSELGIEGGKQAMPSEMFDKTIAGILRNGSPEAVNELRFLVGQTDKGLAQKTGEKFMDRLASRFLYDSFFRSFAKQPDESVAQSLDLFNKLQEQGMVRTVFADEILERSGTEDLLSQRKIKGLETIEGDVERITKDKIGKTLDPEALGEFKGIDNLRQNLGLLNPDGSVNSTGRERLKSVFGGGAKGEQTLTNLEDFLTVIDEFYGQAIGDSNKFLMRRIALTGVAVGTSLAGGFFGGVGVTVPGLILFPLLLRGFGGLFSNPKYSKALLDFYTPDERKAQLGKGSLKDFPDFSLTAPLGQYLSPRKRRQLSLLLNYFTDEDDQEKIDVNKISSQQLMDYLNKRKTFIPRTKLQYDDLSPEMLKRAFPEEFLYRNSSIEDKRKYDELRSGFLNARAETDAIKDVDAEQGFSDTVNFDQMVRAGAPTDQGPAPTPQAQARPQAVSPLQLSQAGQRQIPGMYAKLFPNDLAGQLVAERNRNA